MTVTEFPVGAADADESPAALELLVDDDVWTIVPAEATGDERMTHWISVPGEVLCDLREWR
ncbi:DUF7511 domain-containing protein [Natrononativus amylolyticus]|uniref:DUF7511 domain-containing protein n=1 Tax=Natrononativus amylolyticus TaxID=2963434 RepID=UPI0020CD8755|nr:hypothetical protein [Natrononativus amylolyticus]